MPFALFHSRFPALAEAETRTVTVATNNPWPLPPGNYGFLDMYCDERGCDCRRAMLWVVSSNRPHAAPEAVIGYGWESGDFYRRWMHGDLSAEELANLMGPALVFGSPQGTLAPALLRAFQEAVLPSDGYRERLVRHYRLFREAVDGPAPGARGKKRNRKLRGR